jgi:tripartite-type tricarboxylate transporter receptor subunit TctC
MLTIKRLHVRIRNLVLAMTAVGVVLVSGADGHAQNFPSKSLRIIVPFPAGGASDVTARMLGEFMAKGLGQTIVVENRPGAGAVVGYEAGARSPADGHTLVVVFPSFVINPTLRRGLNYDPMKDFKSVSQTMALPMGIATHPSLPVKSMSELIALARARPGELAYGSTGNGTTQHIFTEMIKADLKVNITHIPYTGGATQITAASGGHVPIAVTNMADIAPFAKMGKVRVIVSTGPERADALPEVPTLREAGFPQWEMTNWSGMVVPGATPAPAITRLNSELVRALRDTQIREKFKTVGTNAVPSTPEEFTVLLHTEAARFAKIVQQAGIKIE